MYDVIQDRYRGCLLGLAIGDALGAPFEFRPRGSFRCEGFSEVRGGTWNLRPGFWTDDTSMALCLADSILERGWDPVDQMERYVRWHRHGYNSSIGHCFDIGGQTRGALARFEHAYNEAIANNTSVNPFVGPTQAWYSGNGSLMRLAPVPMAYSMVSLEELAKKAEESSRTTHGSDPCVRACSEMAFMVAVSLCCGDAVLNAMSTRIGPYSPWPLVKFDVARGLSEDQIASSGFVEHTFDAAIWAVANSKDFRSAALTAVNLGGDSDTTGAVTGMLAGAIYGERNIPRQWIHYLHESAHIRGVADSLFEFAGRTEESRLSSAAYFKTHYKGAP